MSRNCAHHRMRATAALLLIAATLCGGGCVRRRLIIRSNPPGAMVYVDDYPIGVTPVGTNFTYYGGRKIRLVKDGYQTLTVMQSIRPPWYQVPPLDFVSENLVPGEIRDVRSLSFNLSPQPVVPAESLLDRAERLRSGMDPALAGAAPPPVEVTPRPTAVPRPGGGGAPPPGIGGQPVYELPSADR